MSKKVQRFIKSFKNRGCPFNNGDILEMYGNQYKVIASKANGMTLLKDSRDFPVALPTQKIEKFLKTNIARQLNKANPLGVVSPKPKFAVTPKGGVRQHHQIGEMQNGKVYVERHGHKYWVNMQTGTTHASADTDVAHHPVQHPDDIKKISDTRNLIKEKADPSDHEQLVDKFNNYVKAAAAFEHIRHAAHALAKNTGSSIPTSMIEKVNNFGDKKSEAARTFKQSYDKSLRKKAGLGE